MKRSKMPIFWPTARKNKKFIMQIRPGPHSSDSAIPLGLIIRDIFHIARNLKEAKQILNTGKILVNGKIRKQYGLPVGLMDILSIGEDIYRMVPTASGLKPMKITDGASMLVKIKNKTVVGKDAVQLNMGNGCNILTKKDEYKTGDSLLLDTKTLGIKKHIKFGKGALVIVVDGTNRGRVGKIAGIHETTNMQPTTLTVTVDGETIIVPKRYVLIVGEDKPAVQLGSDE